MIWSNLLALLLAPLLMAGNKKRSRPQAKSRKPAPAKGRTPVQSGTKGALRGKDAKKQMGQKQMGHPFPPPPPPTPKPKEPVVLPFEKLGKIVAPVSAPLPVAPINGARIPDLMPRFGWRFVANAQHYQVTWSNEPNLANARSLLANETAATLPPDHALTAGKTFFWRVRAGNESGWGPWSPIQEFGTPEPAEEEE